ncbi:MAG: hypothetical protein K0S81_3655 [Rhodospirillales bacterium]|nr:hypothetical protein [Rhodospirillales bacterium]
MQRKTPDEAKQANIAMMGKPLGEQYSLLWQEVMALHASWHEYVELFGTNLERVEVLNRAAPSFFGTLQNELWDGILLGIARLTDSSSSGRKSNLSVENLPALIDDPKIKAAVESLVAKARERSSFCRDWRNRRIAHRDLTLALDRIASPLEGASRIKVSEALAALAEILNAVQVRYEGGITHYDPVPGSEGALTLLHILDEGLEARERRLERFQKGSASEDDYRRLRRSF